MKRSDRRRTLILALILAAFGVGYTLAHNKVAVVPLDSGISASELTFSTKLTDCESICRDAPLFITCPDSEVVGAVWLPEFHGDEAGCNSSPGGLDDYAVVCCRIEVTVTGQ